MPCMEVWLAYFQKLKSSLFWGAFVPLVFRSEMALVKPLARPQVSLGDEAEYSLLLSELIFLGGVLLSLMAPGVQRHCLEFVGHGLYTCSTGPELLGRVCYSELTPVNLILPCKGLSRLAGGQDFPLPCAGLAQTWQGTTTMSIRRHRLEEQLVNSRLSRMRRELLSNIPRHNLPSDAVGSTQA